MGRSARRVGGEAKPTVRSPLHEVKSKAGRLSPTGGCRRVTLSPIAVSLRFHKQTGKDPCPAKSFLSTKPVNNLQMLQDASRPELTMENLCCVSVGEM